MLSNTECIYIGRLVLFLKESACASLVAMSDSVCITEQPQSIWTRLGFGWS